MSDAYIYFGPDPAGDPEVEYLLVEASGVGRLRPSKNIDGEWALSSVAPGNYGTVTFTAEDVEEAKSNAIAWIRSHQPELLEMLSGGDEDEHPSESDDE